MLPENKAETFSSEDSSNVIIPCALSAIAYELMSNFESIFKDTTSKSRPHKIKLYEVWTVIFENSPSFVLAANRFQDLIVPNIKTTVQKLTADDLVAARLTRNMSLFIE